MKRLFVTIPNGKVKNTFLPEYICNYMEQWFEVEYNPYERELTQEELRAILKDYDVVLTGWGTQLLDKSVLKGNERLKLIVHTGGTVGNYVDEYVYRNNIRVYSGNIMYATSVAEGTIAYMLMALRRIPDYIGLMRTGGWKQQDSVYEGLLDRTVGIVGLGTISRILIRMLQIFDVKIKIFSHYEIEKEFLEKYNCEATSLEDIFATCDIVSVHSALNEDNRNLIQKNHFELLKDGALFINTSRGAVIDEAALIEELKKNRFRAVLDVYTEEPPAQNSILRKLENVYPMPHMAGPTIDRRPIISKALVDVASDFFEGKTESEFEITEEMVRRMTKM